MNLESQLTPLENAELVHRISEEEGMYMFKHALVQDAAYELLLKQDRRRLHRLVARVTEQLHADELDEYASLLARHYAEAGDEAKAYEHAIRAGDVAVRLHAYPEARVQYTNALGYLPSEPESKSSKRKWVDAAVKLASVSLFADDLNLHLVRLGKAESLLTGLDEEADRLRHARTHYWRGRVHYFRNEMPQALCAFKETLTLAQNRGDAELEALPASVIGRAMGLQGHWAASQPLLMESIEPLQQVGRRYDAAVTMAFAGLVRAQQGEYAAGLAEALRALDHATEIDHPTAISVSHVIVSFIRLMGSDYARAIEHALEAMKIARTMDDIAWVYVAHGLCAWALGRMGKFSEAMAEFEKQELFPSRLGGSILLSDWFAAARAEITLAMGDAKQAIQEAQSAVDRARAMGGVYAEGLAERTLGQALAKMDSSCWAEAESHLNASWRAFDNENACIESARTRMALGELYKSRDLSIARDYWSQSAEIFASAGIQPELTRAQDMMRNEPD